LAAALGCGCGGARAHEASLRQRARTPTSAGKSPASAGHAPAFGLTEDNAQLLAPDSGIGGEMLTPSERAALASARGLLAALHPSYVRLLINWAALQPAANASPQLETPTDGCAREATPCAPYDGVAAELRALARRQRAARAEGEPGYEVVLDVFGVPAWAARQQSGCETPDERAFARAITPAGLAGYRSLIRALLALGRREGVSLAWWTPWNEPNDARFVSPQRAKCATSSPSLAPALYAQLAQAMATELAANDDVSYHLLLGELADYPTPSPRSTSVAEFVASLPAGLICLSANWSIHAYASYGARASSGEPVATLEAALDKRGECGRDARIWVTEVGAGAPHAGRAIAAAAAASDEREGCLALAAQLERWVANPRVATILQYTFRDDPAFPVGLLSANLTRTQLDYGLWLSYTRALRSGRAPPPAARLCA
jgi:hypothetical protein